MKNNINTANQLATFFGGNMIGCRLALSLYLSGPKMYLAGFSAGAAALEGYNISYERTRKDARRKIMLSFVRLSLNTLCFMIDKTGSDDTVYFKNFSFLSQLGGLMFGIVYGELYSQARALQTPN